MMSTGSHMHPSRCDTVMVRGLRCNVRRWGPDDAPPILFLHGTRDSSITFQFVVDQLRNDWSIIAPDWRGHGLSQWLPQSYWLHEFVADLDVLIDTLFGDARIPIVGHSLGGNIAGIYAGIRPERLTHLVSLDGFGPLVNTLPVDPRAALQRFVDIPRTVARQQRYASTADMAGRLQAENRRLSSDQALFLATHSSADDGRGGRVWRFDPTHRTSLPSLHTIEDWHRVWSAITAPVLWVASGDHRPHAPTSIPGEMERRARMVPNLTRTTIRETGHNLHHDQPGALAELIEQFLLDRPAAAERAQGRALARHIPA